MTLLPVIIIQKILHNTDVITSITKSIFHSPVGRLIVSVVVVV